MKSFITAAVSLLALGATASPIEVEERAIEERAAACMTKAEAGVVAQNFRANIHETFNKTLALTSMTKNFHDYSDSVLELINNGCPATGATALGQPTFSSRKAFIQGQSSQPPIPFHILKMWHNCDTVMLRWRAKSGLGPAPTQELVTGIIVIEVVHNPKKNAEQPWLIDTVYSEFNSGAWLYDLQVFKPNCTTSTKRSLEAPKFIGML